VSGSGDYALHRKSRIATAYLDPVSGPATGLKIGDVLETLDGIAVDLLLERWLPYYPASNRPTQLRDISRTITRGNCVETAMGFAVTASC
jgi:hypothetical protein